MLAFAPAQVRPAMGRVVARAIGENAPPPMPDFITTGYTGLPSYVETFLMLAIAGSASWVGIRVGMSQSSRSLRVAGWIGGVGSAILGLLYLGGRTGLGDTLRLPAVRVTPS
jgi:hypothetical protein